MTMGKAPTIASYLESLPPDRRAAIEGLRKVINQHLPKGYEEGMGFGMIGYTIPLSRYPDTYNKQPLCVAAIASHKTGLSLYLTSVYGSDELREWFQGEWKKSGKKLDMGKSCIRFKSLDDVPLDVVGQAIAKVPVDKYIALHEAGRAGAKAKAKSK